MAAFSPIEALTKKYGPFPGYVWFGIIAVVGFFWMRTQQNKAGTLNDDGSSAEDKGEFESTVRTSDGEGNETEYSARGPNSGFLGLVGQPVAGPMPSSMGDVYVNLPGEPTQGKTYQTYKVKKGEGLHQIADLLFGDDNYWRDIYRLNSDQIGNNPWINLEGMVLKIPEGETVPDGPKSGYPSWADVGGKQAEKDLYKKYEKDPHTLAKILDQWSKENEHKNKSLSIQQRDWAAKLRAKK